MYDNGCIFFNHATDLVANTDLLITYLVLPTCCYVVWRWLRICMIGCQILHFNWIVFIIKLIYFGFYQSFSNHHKEYCPCAVIYWYIDLYDIINEDQRADNQRQLLRSNISIKHKVSWIHSNACNLYNVCLETTCCEIYFVVRKLISFPLFVVESFFLDENFICLDWKCVETRSHCNKVKTFDKFGLPV